MNWKLLNPEKLAVAGGQADLIVGQRSDTGEWVVIKFLREHGIAECRRWFARQARILRMKLHPSLVPLIDGDEHAAHPYYVMPYFPDGALTSRAGKLNAGELRAAALQIAEGIAALHAQDIVHGDVKPDNLLRAPDGGL